MTEPPRKQPFDEQAALAELERFREAIRAAQRARQAASDEFERFVRGFRTPPPEDASEATPTAPPPLPPPQTKPAVTNSDSPSNIAPAPSQASTVVTQPAALPEPPTAPKRAALPELPPLPESAALPLREPLPEPAALPPPLESAAPLPESGALPPPLAESAAPLPESAALSESAVPLPAALSEPGVAEEPAAETPAEVPSASVRRRGSWMGVVAVIALVAVATIGWIMFRPRLGGAPSGSLPAVSAPRESPATSPPAATPAPPPTPAPPVTSAAVSVELTAVNAVWVRVIVDERKEFEDIVPAGQRLQFSGDRAIVVRAGSGGDVMVKSGGREERFGAAGQPLTRTFSPSTADR